jgi:hypothetical protein
MSRPRQLFFILIRLVQDNIVISLTIRTSDQNKDGDDDENIIILTLMLSIWPQW